MLGQQMPLLNLELAIQLGWGASEPQESSCLCFPSPGIVRVCLSLCTQPLAPIPSHSFVSVFFFFPMLKAWWHTPLIAALGKQRQMNFCVQGQLGVQSELQDIQNPCFKKQS